MKKTFALIVFLLAACVAVAYAATSNANVVFTEGDGPTTPVDPDVPTSPLPGGEPVYGSFVIVDVTSFDFGTVSLGHGAIHQPINVEKPNIQTVDLRGVGSGWNITAKLGQFTDSEDAPSLIGAAITIADGRPNSQYDLPAPTNTKNVILTAGSQEPSAVISASSGQGIGQWVMRWYPQSSGEPFIYLDIPVGVATAGAHKAVIEWTMTDGP